MIISLTINTCNNTPDGNQISFSFEYEKDADGNDVVDKDGNRNLTGITMTVTGKVLNISNKDVDIDDAISELAFILTEN